MPEETGSAIVHAETGDRLVSAARTSLGDTLRSVVYFTSSTFEVLYIRTDLYASETEGNAAKQPLVELEQAGFAEVPIRSTIADTTANSTIGQYQFTVRFHADGFVVRVIQSDAGVLFTADRMDVAAFEDAATAIRKILATD